MSPSHHCPDPLLTKYALGSASSAEAVVVATHLTLCPLCRARSEALEAAGGALLNAAEPEGVSTDEIDSLFARLDEPPEIRDPGPSDPAGVLPRPLVRFVGGFDDLHWRWRLPKVRTVDLQIPVEGTLPLRLVRLGRGYHLPVHDHAGEERAVILAGGWSDQNGDFHRGDFCHADATLEGHDQRCFPDEDCIVLVLNDAAIIPHSPLMKWLTSLLPPL